ncbi:hypothetical protein LCGC14_2025680, partial [marine sediment metagenome]
GLLHTTLLHGFSPWLQNVLHVIGTIGTNINRYYLRVSLIKRNSKEPVTKHLTGFMLARQRVLEKYIGEEK